MAAGEWLGYMQGMINTTAALAEFCERCAGHPYVTIDTEFLRERTYYSQLCLIQLAHPGEGEDTAKLIDPLSEDLDLAPLYELFRNTDVTKVFHAARQDLEIFFVDKKVFPEPFFDTQVAAMVCGYGEQVGYETLVRKIAKGELDKSSRFTDWSRRPLTQRQQDYALADVTHLRQIYEYLDRRLQETDRRSWVEEELSVLINPGTYTVDPEVVWKRVKTRNTSPKFLAIVRELAKFREITAQSRNVPRNRILKDDALIELAGLKPKSVQDLSSTRLLLRDARKGEIAEGIIASVAKGLACDPKDFPRPAAQSPRRQGSEGVSELLRVLLKATSERSDVAQKLIATSADLDRLAAEDEPDIPAMHGWRYRLFGADAMRLKSGKVALAADGNGVALIEVGAGTPPS